ncbi:MAG: type II toxin-antitoxin system mRNA interferase toxin, RelE/StbE family [Chloroflexi bacterium]|nr:MAG: type II toxin-antitoxin system mRNA interferase toxin, RelE/StbE family [Chloroflexota bacterium]
MPERPRWSVIIKRQAGRTLRRLPKDLATRLTAAIDALAENPRPAGCIKLTGFDNFWRIRVGGWRIVYAIHDDELIVLVIEIEPRGGAYRNL